MWVENDPAGVLTKGKQVAEKKRFVAMHSEEMQPGRY